MHGMDGTDAPPPPPPPPAAAAAGGSGRGDLHLDGATGALGGFAGEAGVGWASTSSTAVSEPRREPSVQDDHGGQSAGGSSASSTKRRQNFAYLKRCSQCSQKQEDCRQRRKLCPGSSKCERWVCASHMRGKHGFNAGRDLKCCVHNNIPSGECDCVKCRTKRVNAGRQPAGRVNGRGHGSRGQGQRGQGHQTSGRLFSTPHKKNEDVFILPRQQGSNYTTVSVCSSSGQNRVVTAVDTHSNRSSCSRADCHELSTMYHGRHQTLAENSNVPSPASSVCKHAKVAFRFLREGRAKTATLVVVGSQRTSDDLVQSIRMAEEKKYLSAKDATALVGVAERARVEGVWPLVKMGDTGFYAVHESRSRTCELNWANVKDLNRSARGGKAGASRRMSNERRLMCKANKGVACSENKARKRTKCVHTLLVALALWRAGGMGTEGLEVGEEVLGEEGGNDGDDGQDPGGASCQRTAQILLDDDGRKYARGLANSLNFMSIYKLPPSLPGGVMSVKATNGATYTTSQQKCSTCRECFSPAGVVEAAKLVTREPGMASVRVERRKCEQCGIYAWASDDWRKTGVYNYNNHLLIEMSLLYSCRDAFMQGTPIQTFFATFLERLREDCDWAEANPDLDNSLSEGTNLLNSLKNAFLSFLAVTDFGFEYRCWIWGKFPEIVTFDGCMKVSTNFVTKRQLMASRPEQTIDVDLVAFLLKLSLVSPIHFGTRVQFVVGAGETVGSSPAWMGPGNRLSERFLKTQRGSVLNESDSFKNGNGAALVEWLAAKREGIGYVDELDVQKLRNLHKLCYPGGGSSKLTTLAGFRDEFKKLHAFWESDGNPNRGSCSKLFLGREGSATTGVLGAFVPSGVMVLHKTLLTEESPRDVSDSVFCFKRAPVLIVYDAACKAAAQIARRKLDMLENGGRVPRLGGAGGAVGVVEGPEGTREPDAIGNDGASSLPRVYLPQLAHLGSHDGFNSLEVRPCSFPVEPVRESTADVYALKEASLPQPGVQSRVDVHELLRRSSNKSVVGGAGRSSFLGATRSLACLLREGIRTLSLFEVLVFTYHWLRKAREHGSSLICLAADGWTLEVGPPCFSVWNTGSGAMPSLEHEQGHEVMGSTGSLDAEKFLYELLIVAVGARNGKVPSLPPLLDGGESGQGDLLVDKDGTSQFQTVIRGLLSYAKAKEDFVADGLKPKGDEERRRAGNAVRSGIGFGAGVFSVKSLQVHLAAGVAPHESTKDDKVAGYDAIFHDTTFDDSDFVVPGEGPRPHPYLGRTSGIFLGPDGPHEKNHNPQCTRDHSGLTTCSEIAGVNLNPHEQDHAKKHVYLRSINTMAFPNFTYALRVINELQNEGINRRTVGRVLRSLETHPVATFGSCHKSLWFCGRCFCLKPTIRVFDTFGRVDVVFLDSVIDAAVGRS